MQEFVIKFRSFQDMQDFAALSARQSFPIRVGTEQYRVNAASLMGLCGLDCTDALRVTAECTSEELEGFLRQAQPLLQR